MCTNYRYIKHAELPAWDRYRKYQSTAGVVVPCGKCFECLRVRQNEIVVRVARELAKLATPAWFITFTYNDDNLPFAHSQKELYFDISGKTLTKETIVEPYIVDRTQGSGKTRSEFILTDPEMQKCTLQHEPRIQDLTLSVWRDSQDIVHEIHDYLTPSSNIYHMQNLLKQFRKWLKRNSVAPSFRYILITEYGNHYTRRPHYHMIIMDITKKEVEKLASMWHYSDNEPLVERIKYIDPKYKGDGFSKVAAYLGKYISKGCFESRAKREGLVTKSRLCASIGFGSSITEEEKNYWLCQDIFKYDQNHFDTEVSPLMQNVIITEIIKRLKISLNGYGYKLPRCIKNKVFNFKRTEDKSSYSPLYYMVEDAIQCRIMQDYHDEIRQCGMDPGTEDFLKAFNGVKAFHEHDFEIREEIAKKSVLRGLNKTKI